MGSPVSRPITERLALASEAVLVLEPAQGLACKTARKGVGDYRLHVTGVAAHSGVDFEHGHSAILELARLMEKVAGFTDLRVGRTVNPGVISGGTRSNVIAEHAYADVDVRIAKASDAAQGGEAVSQPALRRSRVQAGDYRRDESSADGAQAGDGGPVQEGARAGGGVGLHAGRGGDRRRFGRQLYRRAGCPTLDGLGAVGEGAHAAHESVVIEHLVPRTALLAALIASL